ncbi:AAA family ATPase [Sediminibacillus massiliensis]|uniref:AAA family ATPase n=1 Tax=Sediminibacillus massiliensis TaxID=1926277 RepID=UPI0009883E10|nr:AAA family ATPase [Sediminibacillus massiliensis]
MDDKAKMIVICSAAGGAGRTTLTVNLAALLAERKLKTVVVDGDLQFGDLALALDLKPKLTLKELAERNETEYVRDYYARHESGVQLLAAPVRPEYAELVTIGLLDAITDSIKQSSDVLLVDTQHGLNEQNLSLMEKADEILVVSTPGMAALKNTKLMLETLEMLGLKDKASLIVNKATASSVIKASEIPELTQIEQAYFLPEDSKNVPNSLDVGKPLVISQPKLDFSKEISKIGEYLFPFEPPASNKMAAGGFLKKVGIKAKGLKIRGERDEFTSQIAVEKPAGKYS